VVGSSALDWLCGHSGPLFRGACSTFCLWKVAQGVLEPRRVRPSRSGYSDGGVLCSLPSAGERARTCLDPALPSDRVSRGYLLRDPTRGGDVWCRSSRCFCGSDGHGRYDQDQPDSGAMSAGFARDPFSCGAGPRRHRVRGAGTRLGGSRPVRRGRLTRSPGA
jgi:hypothetical protein